MRTYGFNCTYSINPDEVKIEKDKIEVVDGRIVYKGDVNVSLDCVKVHLNQKMPSDDSVKNNLKKAAADRASDLLQDVIYSKLRAAAIKKIPQLQNVFNPAAYDGLQKGISGGAVITAQSFAKDLAKQEEKLNNA